MLTFLEIKPTEAIMILNQSTAQHCLGHQPDTGNPGFSSENLTFKIIMRKKGFDKYPPEEQK